MILLTSWHLEYSAFFTCLILVFTLLYYLYSLRKISSAHADPPAEENHEAYIRIDPGKKLYQEVRFLLRLKKQMRKFKQRKVKNQELEMTEPKKQ